MEKPVIGKSVCRKWILPVLAVLLLIAALIIWQRKKQETEYSIIQAIIEELPYYQDGGMYCFYYGFDQYISERTYKENMLLFPVSQYDGKEYEEVLKTVRLQISKRTIEQEPFFENTADADSKDRYDVSVRIEITAESLADGNELSVVGGGFFETNYCSNNFEECRLWNGIDPASANSYSDHNIKQEYSAVQLLEYYRQGLELQSRLVGLYCERQGEHGR